MSKVVNMFSKQFLYRIFRMAGKQEIHSEFSEMNPKKILVKSFRMSWKEKKIICVFWSILVFSVSTIQGVLELRQTQHMGFWGYGTISRNILIILIHCHTALYEDDSAVSLLAVSHIRLYYSCHLQSSHLLGKFLPVIIAPKHKADLWVLI